MQKWSERLRRRERPRDRGRSWREEVTVSIMHKKKIKKKKRSERNQCSESWGDTARNALWTQVLPKSC